MTRLLSYLRHHPMIAAAYVFCMFMMILALVGPYITPYNPVQADPVNRLQPPSTAHWSGTDSAGLDIFSRILVAPRIDLVIAIVGVLVSLISGTACGLISAFFDHGLAGSIGQLILRITDMVQSFPVFVLAMALVALSGQNVANIIYAVAFVNAPFYLRLVYARGRSLRRRGFVDAARVAGVNDWKILWRHILPNALVPVIVLMSVNVGGAILLTAGLSFIGAGVRAPTPEWGLMIAQGSKNVITGHWWPSVLPGLALTLAVFSFALVGQSLEDLLDPRRAALYDELPTLQPVAFLGSGRGTS